MDPLIVIRLINLILVIITIAAWSYFHRKFREPIAFAPLTWLIDVLAFYLYRYYILINHITGIESLNLLNLWSTILILHGILLLLFGVFIAIPRLLDNKTYMSRLEEKLKKEKEERIK